ncbi:MAG TPA: CarD family transcriptional regulator [Xanthobacteraceae bacterium]|nr:CarD family transcriptional regulator [Xanthobacteraceae bacterium]
MTSKKPAQAAKSNKTAAHAGAKKAETRKAHETVKKAAATQHGRKPSEHLRKAVELTSKPTAPAKKAAEAMHKPADAPKKVPEQTRKLSEPSKKAPEQVVKKPAEEPAAAKKTNQRQGFRTNEFIVYPSHGVGQIMAIEEQEVAGYKLELFVISFAKDKMTLRVPTTKVAAVGMRKLAEPALVKRALDTLKGRARIKRTMWSRRAQEYEAKINSGDIVAIAEVVRDLYRSESQPEQSYSERQLYEAALDRLAREIAAVERITETEAVKQIEASLAKGPRRGPKTTEGAEGDAEEEAIVVEEAEAA